MNRTFVDKKFFNDVSHISFNYNDESDLYIKKFELLKILKKSYREERKDVIEQLDRINHKYCANPTSILYDRTGTIGYSMYYYRLYDTIDKLINNGSVPYKDRIEIVKKLYEVFENFDKNKFSYSDIHEKNILFYDNDIKIVDLDSGLFKNKINSIDFSISKRIQDARLARMVLSILYEIPYYKIQKVFNNKEFFKKLPNNLKDLFDYVTSDKYTYFDSSDYLDLFTEEFIHDTKFVLK